MGNKNILKIIDTNNYSISPWLLKAVVKEKVSLEELILIIYFLNLKNRIFDIEDIESSLGISPDVALETFNSLLIKKLIKIETNKDYSKKIQEKINIEKINELIMDEINHSNEKEIETNIFESFEKEFGRTLSPMEYEIINGWLSKNISEELVLNALKEATYNGVSNLRYIDKILNEWCKKGYKNTEDIKKNSKPIDTKKEELFDYNWLDDEE